MSAKLFSFLILALFTAACGDQAKGGDGPPPVDAEAAQSPPLKPAMVAVEKWFLVNTPERGFTVVQTTKDGAMDFEIFEVRKAAMPYVRVYVGNAAEFPSEIMAGSDGRRTRTVTHPGGVETNEFLLATRPGVGLHRFTLWSWWFLKIRKPRTTSPDKFQRDS